MNGKLIVIYGINNLGKSTQAKLLVEALKKQGHKAEYLKYPLYDLRPFGPLINAYLREGNPFGLSPREFQLIQLLNKLQYQEELKKKLESGTIVVAEDYRGTSLAWGIGSGVDERFLKETNQVLRDEDLVFLFDGERFTSSIEKGHRHEEDKALMAAVRQAHQKLGQEYGWLVINANQPKEKIHRELFQKVEDFLGS